MWRLRATLLPAGLPVRAGIDAAGAWTADPPPDAETLPGRYLLPGLVDAHCHLSVAAGGDGPVGLDLDATRANLTAARWAGVTAIRDTGSPRSVTLELLPDEDDLLACGRFLAPPGQYIPALYRPVPVEDLVDAALAEVAAGARWVKLVGDFPRSGQAATPTYPVAAVAALVDAVHAAGARVAAHSTTRHVSQLIASGIDSVEHGTELTEDDLATLGRRGGAWTPTLCASLGDSGERRERLGGLLRGAAGLGVTVLTGTDVVGTVPREVALLAALGLSPVAALDAASGAARRFLGFPEPTAGQPVDLVSYADDPRQDPGVLAQPVAVIRRGVRIR